MFCACEHSNWVWKETMESCRINYIIESVFSPGNEQEE